jgi:hypothetical protein
MAGYRTYILITIMLAALAAVFFALPDSSPPASGAFVKCSACHPEQADELKRAFFHTSMQCADCHRLSEFREDLRSHDAATLACTACHAGIPRMKDKKSLDHTSFNVAYY